MNELRTSRYQRNERNGIIVYIKHLKNIRQLRYYGKIHYVSKKMKYVLLYVNKNQLDETVALLNRQNFIRKVLPSLKPDIKIDYHKEEGR